MERMVDKIERKKILFCQKYLGKLFNLGMGLESSFFEGAMYTTETFLNKHRPPQSQLWCRTAEH